MRFHLLQETDRLPGTSSHELAFIAGQCRQFAFPGLANIEHVSRLSSVLEMDAIVIVNALRVMRLTGQVGLGQFRPEPGRLNQLGSSDVIRVSIDEDDDTFTLAWN